MIVNRGFFIVFEGCDCSGKTTQCNALHKVLNLRGTKCEKLSFPDRQTEIGQLINAYLQNKQDLDDHAIHLLFSANRWEKMKTIKELLLSGQNIIIDRYAYSGVAFSSAKPNLDFEWCKSTDNGLIAPDLIIYLDIPMDKIGSRLHFGNEKYETVAFQKKVYQYYKKLIGSSWKVINADQDIHDVSRDVHNVVEQFMEEFSQKQDKDMTFLWE